MNKFLFYNKFIIFLYMFRALRAEQAAIFDVLLNVHLSIILITDQFNAQILVL